MTREMDCMEFSGEREVSVVVLANIMLGQCWDLLTRVWHSKQGYTGIQN